MTGHVILSSSWLIALIWASLLSAVQCTEAGIIPFEMLHASTTNTSSWQPLATITDLNVNPSAQPSSLPSRTPSRAPSTRKPTRKPTKRPTTRRPTPKPTKPKDDRLNVLIITADQHRYDAIRFIQEKMAIYNNKLKVKTPNLDRLAQQGVWFQNAYAQSSSCAPARATLRSGTTVERHGIQGIKLVMNWDNDPLVRNKVNAIRTYDQVLHGLGYQCETYGKLHVPTRWSLTSNGTGRAIQYDSYSYDMKEPEYNRLMIENQRYINQVKYWTKRDKIRKVYDKGMQTNVRTDWPYTPLPLDPRFGKVKRVHLPGEDSYVGIDSLPPKYSVTSFTGQQAQNAIQRLAKGHKPWVLTVSFEHPHPPFVVAARYASYYLQNQDKILLPPNMNATAGNDYYTKKQREASKQGYANAKHVRGWIAIYYAMVEQVDAWVGVLLDELERQNVADNTMVIFTSDHGEFLGSFGLQGKFGLLEEALRVPFFMRLPKKIKAGRVVKRPVSHLDMFATILDYLGYSKLNKSDGNSLRPVIEGRNWKKYYDDDVAVSEVDLEDGDNNLGFYPNFMIRHGDWKLMMAKNAGSNTQDLLFDLDADPFEKKNIILRKSLSPLLIGKAEHLKCLLLEWLRRNDGASNIYSSPKFNYGQGRGDIREIAERQTWDRTDQWISDQRLEFNPPVYTMGKWRSNAWLYIGRTTAGTLKISSISVEGTGRQYFSLSNTQGSIAKNGHIRVKVSFVSARRLNPNNIDARIVIRSNVSSQEVVQIVIPWRVL